MAKFNGFILAGASALALFASAAGAQTTPPVTPPVTPPPPPPLTIQTVFNGTDTARELLFEPVGPARVTVANPSPTVEVVTTSQPGIAIVSSQPEADTLGPLVINGVTYTGTRSLSGFRTDSAFSTTVVTTTAGTPPTVVTTGPTVTSANIPAETRITSVTARGVVGEPIESFGAVLSSGTVITNGSVVATSNTSYVTTSGAPETGGFAGAVFTQSVGTATFDPATGAVVVALPAAPTSRTSVTAGGISTTGAISSTGDVSARTFTANVGGAAGAAAINAGGGRVTGIANGTSTTDAVNLGQLNTATAAQTSALNAAVATLNGTISTGLDDARREAEAGTAIAVALGGGFFLPEKKVNISVNFGTYRGETAIAGIAGFLVSDNVAITGGFGTSLNGAGGTAARGGVTFGF